MRKAVFVGAVIAVLLNFWISESIAETISGTVRDNLGNPVPGVEIIAEDVATQTQFGSVVANDTVGEVQNWLYCRTCRRLVGIEKTLPINKPAACST